MWALLVVPGFVVSPLRFRQYLLEVLDPLDVKLIHDYLLDPCYTMSILARGLLCLRSLLIRSHTAWLQPSAPRAPRWSLVVSACLLLPMQLLSAPLRASWAWLSVAHAAMLALVYGSLCLGLVGLPCVSSYVCCSHPELVFCGSCSSCHYLCWHLGFAFSNPCSHSCTCLWLLVLGARESPM